MTRPLAGTGRLVRFILRRDRFLLPGWVVWMSFVPLAAASAFKALYPDPESLARAAGDLTNNAAFRAMFGPVYGTDLGSLVTWRASIILLIGGVLSALTVIRHTRVEEETGRRELVGSAVVGRHAPLTAALIVVGIAALALGVLVSGALIAQGLQVVGSIGLGIQLAAAVVVFGAVGAVAAQLTESAGGARAIALAVLGLAYVLRAAGDAGGMEWLSWLSPIGWIQRLRPYGGERWWVLLLVAALTAVVVLAAFVMSTRRDVGGGLFQPRLGPATGSPRLTTPLGLAWRIHRGILIGWTAGLLVLGTIYGAVAEGVGDLIRDNPDFQEIFGRLGGAGVTKVIDLYLSGVMGVLGLLAAAYAIQAALRMRVEEEGLRADPILATATSRLRWVGTHLVLTFGGSVVVLGAAGLAVGVLYGVVSGDFGQIPRVLAAALVRLPAVWVLVGITVALFGLVPRASYGGWIVFGAVVFILFIGAILQLGQWFLDLSPFTHVPTLPGGPFRLLPVLALSATAAGLVAAGVAGFLRRDVN